MDHYRVLGITRNATKEEIKEAFRKLAMKFHPDRHAQSSNPIKESATVKFKQVSEAYEVLMDDRKRSSYDFGYGSTNNRRNGYSSSSSYSGGNYGYGYNYGGNSDYYTGRYKHGYGSSGDVRRFEVFLQYMKTRAFLINLAFAGVLFGGIYVIDMARERLWEMQNSGKSFEAAMESIDKAKARSDEK